MKLLLNSFPFLVAVLMYQSLGLAEGAANNAEVKAWIRANLPHVFIGPPENGSLPPKGMLMLHLGILDRQEKDRLEAIIKERMGAPVKVDEMDKIPVPIAEKVLAGFQWLKENNLVLLAPGLSQAFEPDIKRKPLHSRAGVMSLVEAKGLIGDGTQYWNEETIGIQKYEGKDVFIPVEYQLLIEYLEFANRYDEATKKWVPKFRWEQWQTAVFRTTEALLKEIWAFDPLYSDDDYVRKAVAANLDLIFNLNIPSPEVRGARSLPLATEKVVTCANLRVLYGKAKSPVTSLPADLRKVVLESFSEYPNIDDKMDAFLKKYGEQFHLKHGYFSERLYKR